MKKRVLSLALTLALVLVLVPLPAAQAADFTPVTGAAMLEKIMLGINFGNTLEATPFNEETGQYWMDRHSLETETCWGEAKIEQWHFKAIAEKGYTAVRLPITWEPHTGADYKIDKVWMDRVQQCVDWALGAGLYVIINTHHEREYLYEFVMDFNHAAAKTELTAIWAQIAERFKDYSEKLIFEPLNEPHLRTGWIWDYWDANGGHVDRNLIEIVNKLNADALKTIRESGGHNDKRVVVECVPAANCAAIEFYEPSGDPYTMLGVFVYPGDNVNLIQPAVNRGIPVIVKEISTVEANMSDAEKLAWTQSTHNALAQMGVPSFWWNHSGHFELFDRYTGQWPRKQQLEAVFTPYGQTPGPDYDRFAPSSIDVMVTTPATGDAPSATAAVYETGFICGPVTWTAGSTPITGNFAGRTQYTASATLTANPGYTFPSGFTATVNGKMATVASNGGTATVTYTFPATASANTGVEVAVDVETYPYVRVTITIFFNGDMIYSGTFPKTNN